MATEPSWVPTMQSRLPEVDPDLSAIMDREIERQTRSVNLIASENFTSKSVFDALGSVMSNKYSEGYPGARYYGGNDFIDEAERLCQERALALFGLDPEQWGVNVQSLSGSPANLQVYSGLLDVHDRIMSLDLPHGGHLSHGYQTPTKKISAVSKFYETFPYRLDDETGLIDYDTLEANARLYRPKLIVAGFSAYSRSLDYARFRAIADEHNAYLLSDMAHVAGLVAAGVAPSPFEHSDVVTTTTHKTLRGPRGAMIFFRKGVRSVTKKGEEVMYDLEEKINFAVFPGLQGGPHNHTISALATALKQASESEFKAYQTQVVKNAATMAKLLMERGFTLVGGGTDNHLMLIDVKQAGVDGARLEAVLDVADIVTNKNTIPGDKSALVPGGLRIGTPAMTTRGMLEPDFEKIVGFIERGVKITADFKKQVSGRRVADFKKQLHAAPPTELLQLRDEVHEFARSFPMVGV